MIIKYDKASAIIKDYFEITLYNKDNPDDRIYFSECRFDFNLNILYKK